MLPIGAQIARREHLMIVSEEIAETISHDSNAIEMLEFLLEALDENYRRVVQETYPEISAVGGLAVGG